MDVTDIAAARPPASPNEAGRCEGDSPDGAVLAAAQAGDANAQGDLAVALFQSGERIAAMPWVRQAAAVGEPRCQYLLGIALFNGDHVVQDRARALALLDEAANAGIEPAVEALAAIGLDQPARLLSSAPEAATRAEFARLRRRQAPPGTLAAMTDAVLQPMLRQRLDETLAEAVQRAVDIVLSSGTAPSSINA